MRLVKKQQMKFSENKIKLSPKINIEEKLHNGYISADDYKKRNISNDLIFKCHKGFYKYFNREHTGGNP